MKQNLSSLALAASLFCSGAAIGQTYNSGGPVNVIHGGGCPGLGAPSSSVINVTDNGVIGTPSGVFINVDYSTTCFAATKLVLVAPDGDSCILLNLPFRTGPCSGLCYNTGGTANTLSFNADFTSPLMTGGGSVVPSGNYAPTGSAYAPEVGNLAIFLAGRSINGDWALVGSGDAGASTSIASWSITFGAGALPLDLVAFTGNSSAGHNELQWATANEINTASFDIQRSTDGTGFQTIGKVPAAGSGNNNYNFSDKTFSPGTNLYKLRMIDIDGQYSYSRTVKVLGTERGTGIKLSPNPVRDALNVTVNNETLLNTEGKIINSLGQTVFTFKIGQMSVKRDIKHLPAGIYLLSLSDGSSYRFVKEI